jgi:O-antigen ligase
MLRTTTTNRVAILPASREAGAGGDAVPRLSSVATACVAILLLTAPFETWTPIVRVAGQSLSSLECVLCAAFVVFVVAAIFGAGRLLVPRPDAPVVAAFVVAAGVSAVLAPEFRPNALHMTGRFLVAGVLWLIVANAGTTRSNRHRIAWATLVAGVVAGALCIADYAEFAWASRIAGMFREQAAVVGAQVRASGPFQYPTIASMFLETAFAIGLGVLMSASRPVAWLGAIVLALGVIAEAIVLTFTRGGMVTMLVSLAFVGWMHARRNGVDRRLVACAVVGAFALLAIVLSRPTGSLALRLATEGQARWFSAAIVAPPRMQIGTQTETAVRVVVTNTGLTTWDSQSPEPVLLSYHWIDADSDVVVSWEGLRTAFPAPVAPGETVALDARVEGPGRPGRFRLMWDLEQRHRLWFSTEPGATVTMTRAEASGPAIQRRPTRGPSLLPHAVERPGRVALWGAALRMFAAHPLSGVGADNYRLLYGRYSSIAQPDPRVHSNNMYLEILAGMGLVGIAAALWLAARVLANLRRVTQAGGVELGVAAALLAWAVHGLADSFMSFTPTYMAGAIVLGLASSCAEPEGDCAHRV